jgi:hypothetical protein
MQALESLLPLLVLAAVGLGIAVIVQRRARAAANAAPVDTLPPGPRGYGGWFILVLIAQTLAPVATAVDLVRELPGMLATSNAIAFAIASIYAAILIAMMAYQIVVASFMYRRSRLFPRLFVYQWFVYVGLTIGVILFLWAAGATDTLGDPDFVKSAVRDIFWSGVLAIYVVKSVRVQNTFVR